MKEKLIKASMPLFIISLVWIWVSKESFMLFTSPITPSIAGELSVSLGIPVIMLIISGIGFWLKTKQSTK